MLSTRNRDQRGRFRATINGIRAEVNKGGKVRLYRRTYNACSETERREHVFDLDDVMSARSALYEAAAAYYAHRNGQWGGSV